MLILVSVNKKIKIELYRKTISLMAQKEMFIISISIIMDHNLEP